MLKSAGLLVLFGWKILKNNTTVYSRSGFNQRIEVHEEVLGMQTELVMKDAFTQPFLGHVCFHVIRALEQASDPRLEWDTGWATERASTGHPGNGRTHRFWRAGSWIQCWSYIFFPITKLSELLYS